MPMSQAVTVPSLTMMTSQQFLRKSLARDTHTTHTHHTHTQVVYVKICKVAYDIYDLMDLY